MYKVSIWLKSLFSIACILAGLWLVLLFKRADLAAFLANLAVSAQLTDLVSQYHAYSGIGLIGLGTLISIGTSNTSRILIGLALLGAGMILFNLFLTSRDGWIGQIITNFVAPAICIFGILTMVNFKR